MSKNVESCLSVVIQNGHIRSCVQLVLETGWRCCVLSRSPAVQRRALRAYVHTTSVRPSVRLSVCLCVSWKVGLTSRADTTPTKPPQHHHSSTPARANNTDHQQTQGHTLARKCAVEWAHLFAVLCSPESTTCKIPILRDPRQRRCDNLLGHGRTKTFTTIQNTPHTAPRQDAEVQGAT